MSIATALVIVVAVFGEAFLIWFLVAMIRETSAKKAPMFDQITREKRPLWRFPGSHRSTTQGRGIEVSEAQHSAKRRMFLGLFVFLVSCTWAAHAQDQPSSAPSPAPSGDARQTWEYGGFIDVGYLHDFNYPVNHLFRSRGTTFHVNEWDVNMTAAYLRKRPTEQSRWGVELTAQAGKDSEVFGYSATAPVLGGVEVAEALRHFGPTNVSYLAPIAKGLTIQGGIFASLIGYDSLYSKDNFNYTRPWGADFTPYLMLGVNASYPVNDKITLTGFVVNGYWHLADANAVPSFGGQMAYKPAAQWTIKQTGMMGPHQAETAFEFWRYLSDTIVEWKRDPVTVAFEFIGATEKVATLGGPRAAWVSAQVPVRWQVTKRWALAARPEVAWDSDGRWTLARQTVKAFTGTIEYRYPIRRVNNILRLEYRVDDSRGPQGGFFDDGYAAPGVPRLKPTQNLLIFGTIFTLDGTFKSGRQ